MTKLMKHNYETRLESSDTADDICAILDAKLEATSPQGVADYIALSIGNIDSAIDRMKDAKEELEFRIKIAERQKEIVKTGCAIWLTNAGVDKLYGDIVSSVSVSESKPKETLKIANVESLINQGYFKTVVDKTAVKNAIKNGNIVDGAEIEVIHDSDTIRINKRGKSVNKLERK